MMVRPGMVPPYCGARAIGDAGAGRGARPAMRPPARRRRSARLAQASIKVLSGAAAGREVPLTKVVTTIGKPGVAVAAITKRQHGFVVHHVEGAGNPSLNGAPIGTDPVPLKNGDLIELGRDPDAVRPSLTGLYPYRRRPGRQRVNQRGGMGQLLRHWPRIRRHAASSGLSPCSTRWGWCASACWSGWTTSSMTPACAPRCRHAGRPDRHRRHRREEPGGGRTLALGPQRLAELTDELFDRQKIAILGFDVVFAEADESSGLKRLNELAQKELRDQGGFVDRLRQLQPSLDYDAMFAQGPRKRAVVLGYYLTSDREGRTSGVLPAPVMGKSDLQGRPISFTTWNGYGSNIAQLAKAAPIAGHFNPIRRVVMVWSVRCR
jgi:hypothetical protein